MILNPLPTSASRVAAALTKAGLETRIVEMPVATRTAEEAARACGCEPAQIVKSLIFRGRTLRDRRLARLRGLAWIWSVENFVLALTVYNRMYIYIDFNGLSRIPRLLEELLGLGPPLPPLRRSHAEAHHAA